MPAVRPRSRKPADAPSHAREPSSSAELTRARARERDAIFEGLERVEGGSKEHRKLLERLGAWQRGGAPPASSSSPRSSRRSTAPSKPARASSSSSSRSRDVVRLQPSARVVESRSVRIEGLGDVTFELRYVQQAQTKRTVAPMYSGSTLSSSSTPSFYGPYWYAEKRNGDRVIWVYVGKRFDKNKARQRLLRKGARS